MLLSEVKLSVFSNVFRTEEFILFVFSGKDKKVCFSVLLSSRGGGNIRGEQSDIPRKTQRIYEIKDILYCILEKKVNLWGKKSQKSIRVRGGVCG